MQPGETTQLGVTLEHAPTLASAQHPVDDVVVLTLLATEIRTPLMAASVGKDLGELVERVGAATAGAVQVSFTPRGDQLVVSEKGANTIETFPVDRHGLASAGTSHVSAGAANPNSSSWRAWNPATAARHPDRPNPPLTVSGTFTTQS